MSRRSRRHHRHRKRSYRRNNKGALLFIVILLLFLFLIIDQEKYNFGSTSNMVDTNDISLGRDTKQRSDNLWNLGSCEQKAAELLPDRMHLHKFGFGKNRWDTDISRFSEKNEGMEDTRWKDNTSIIRDNFGSTNFFEIGSKEGENINHYYLKQSDIAQGMLEGVIDLEMKRGLIYKKQIISAEGLVLGFREFSINPVLKPVESTRKSVNWGFRDEIEDTVMAFEIVSYEFFTCNWIND